MLRLTALAGSVLAAMTLGIVACILSLTISHPPTVGREVLTTRYGWPIAFAAQACHAASVPSAGMQMYGQLTETADFVCDPVFITHQEPTLFNRAWRLPPPLTDIYTVNFILNLIFWVSAWGLLAHAQHSLLTNARPGILGGAMLGLSLSLATMAFPVVIRDNTQMADLRFGWPIAFIAQDAGWFQFGGDGPPLPARRHLASPWENITALLPVQFLTNWLIWTALLYLLYRFAVMRFGDDRLNTPPST